MIKCISHKKVYPTLEIAEDALIDARTNFDYAPHSGPIAVYQCEDCGRYHLTSKGTMNQKLAQFIADGNINRQNEDNRWLYKLKRNYRVPSNINWIKFVGHCCSF